jgi:serine/threonine-protein kinase HipA
MAIGNNRHYRIKEIQPRHFYQTGQKSGLSKIDIDSIFSELIAKLDDALDKVTLFANEVGMPKSTFEPILKMVHKRAKLIRL